MFRNRWVRRGFVGLVAGLVILVVGVFIHRSLTRPAGEKRYAEIVAHLDATDPRWRYDEIDADRGSMPDDRNGALLIPTFHAALAQPRFDKDPHLGTDYATTVPPNDVLDDETYAAIAVALSANADALAVAARFRDYPRGLRRYTLTPNPFDTPLTETQETRHVVRLLDLAAERAGRDGRGGTALSYVRPMIHAARSVDGEPFLISALVRLFCLRTAASRVERTLGLCVPRAHLADVQSLLAAEAESDLLWSALRGERATTDVLFERLSDGSLSVDQLRGRQPKASDSDAEPAAQRYLRHLPADRARYLEFMTRVYELRLLPEHKQRAALIDISWEIRELDKHDLDSLVSGKVLPAFAKVHDASLRIRALLRCAVVGVAVERFRLAHGRWPASLAEIPTEILPAIPADPFDGKPLRYVQRADGVTVYSIGLDESDNGGKVPDRVEADRPGEDIGFRLYDPARRGLPPDPPNPFREFLRPDEEGRVDGAPPEPGPEPREVGAK